MHVLTPAARLVGAGAIAIAASMLLPWYGIQFSHGLSVTALDSFGFAHLALLISAAAAVFCAAREAAGAALPRPLQWAELVILAGAWAAVLTGFLMFDRPDELGGSTEIGLRYGIFVALGGCGAVALGGVRMRAERRGRAAAT
jgi:hypothetical protein